MARKRNKGKAAGASAAEAGGGNDRVLARNRRGGFNYAIEERLEAGLALLGSEIKSLREGRGSIAEAYVRPKEDELWLIGATIPRYEPAASQNHEPARDRKLLLHKREIRKLSEAFEQRGLTLVPLRLYLTRGIAKLEIGVGRGKRQYEKRQLIAKRDAERQMQRALRR